MSEASDLLVEVTILAALFCCYFCLLLNDKSVMSGFLSTSVGLLSAVVGLLSNGVGLFSRQRVLEMGVFSRDYGTERLPLANHLSLSSCSHPTFMRDSRLIHTVDCP